MLKVEVIGANSVNAEEIKNVVTSAIGSSAEIITVTIDTLRECDKADLYVCLINRKQEMESVFGPKKVVTLELVPPTKYFLDISQIPRKNTVIIFNNSTSGTRVLLHHLKLYDLLHVNYKIVPYDEMSYQEVIANLDHAKYITGGIAYVGKGSDLYTRFGEYIPQNAVVLVSPPRVATSESICNLSNVFSRLYHKKVMDELKRLSCVDYLTQIPNRRTFDETLRHEWQRAKQEKIALSLAMIDIDFFKNYNDHYGHLAGDECLKSIAQVLKSVMRQQTDFCARYGGEEYTAILPNTEANVAYQVLEKFRNAVISLGVCHDFSAVLPVVTVSVGITTTMTINDDIAVEDFLKRADQALYQAKNQGRNKVVVK